MTTSVSIHNVTHVVTSTHEANGTKWTNITVYDDDGTALEFTLFNSAQHEQITGVEYENEYDGEDMHGG
jgi:hypothetical protein